MYTRRLILIGALGVSVALTSASSFAEAQKVVRAGKAAGRAAVRVGQTVRANYQAAKLRRSLGKAHVESESTRHLGRAVGLRRLGNFNLALGSALAATGSPVMAAGSAGSGVFSRLVGKRIQEDAVRGLKRESQHNPAVKSVLFERGRRGKLKYGALLREVGRADQGRAGVALRAGGAILENWAQAYSATGSVK
jgi:hypothetical protein